jgi:hypothetical protein
VQDGDEGHVRNVCQRLTQGEGLVRRQLGDEPLGKRPARLAVVLIGGRSLTGRHRLTSGARRHSLLHSTVQSGIVALAGAGLGRELILRSNIAALDPHPPVIAEREI